MDGLAVAIAVAFALLGLGPLAGRRMIGRPFLWLCVLAGAISGPIAREGAYLAWEWVSPFGALYRSAAAAPAQIMLAVGIAELVKATVPLALVGVLPTDAPAALAYGAGAGAGFAAVTTHLEQGLVGALRLVGSPITTPLSTMLAVTGYLFPVLLHTGTTAYVSRAGVRGGLGGAFLLAWVLQVAAGLAGRLPLVAGVPVGRALGAALAVVLIVVLWRARLRAESATAALAD
ncbi:MAG: hypothetical protein QN183_05730 [Armatimonadota bacterium]|nr:hypothetical protein [Armatimonadota bacterium]